MNQNTLRYLQKKILKIQERIIFKTSHISLWGKIVLFWSVLCFISLFFSWGWTYWTLVRAENIENYSFNSFSAILWFIWYFILSLLALIVFAVSSIKKKQKIKYFSLIEIRDYNCSIISSAIIFFAALHSFFITFWLKLFSSNITHSHGVILCMTGAVIMFFWGIVIRSEYRMNIKWSYINDSHRVGWDSEFKEHKDNMKLPF